RNPDRDARAFQPGDGDHNVGQAGTLRAVVDRGACAAGKSAGTQASGGAGEYPDCDRRTAALDERVSRAVRPELRRYYPAGFDTFRRADDDAALVGMGGCEQRAGRTAQRRWPGEYGGGATSGG